MTKNYSRAHYWKGIALGSFLGIELVLFSLLILDIGNLRTDQELIWTIAIGALPIFAAFLALRGVANQIGNQNELSENVRIRKLSAAKSTLPLVLSELISVARRGAEINLDREIAEKSPRELFRETLAKRVFRPIF